MGEVNMGDGANVLILDLDICWYSVFSDFTNIILYRTICICLPCYIHIMVLAHVSAYSVPAKGLDLYQVLSPNAYSYKEEFIPVIRKTVQSQVNEVGGP